jgi:hypothetical protein
MKETNRPWLFVPKTVPRLTVFTEERFPAHQVKHSLPR